jgi:SAM-dependent methyltransferase
MRFFEISEEDIGIQNPFPDAKLNLVGEICRTLGHLQPGGRMLDLACGQGEMLCRWAQQYGIGGTGVDISGAFLNAARRRAGELGVASQVEFVQQDVVEYLQSPPAYDVVSCVGGGIVGTINLMRKALKEGGLLLIGDLFWEREPNDAAAAAMGMATGDVQTLPALYDQFGAAGAVLLNMVVADLEGWDRYQTYHWVKIHQWLQAHPDDPDAAQFRAEIEDWKRSYLVYRGHFGWGMFLLRVK